MQDPDSRLCPVCGRAADPEASFCEVCGADLPSKGDSRGNRAETAAPRRAEEVRPAASAREEVPGAEPGNAAPRRAEEVRPFERVPEPVSRAKRAEAAEPCRAEAIRPAEPVPAPASAFRTDPRDEVPFELEWDAAREFIEGETGTFSFKFLARCDFSRVRLVALAGEETLFRLDLRDVSADGRWISRAAECVPGRNGRISVRLRAVVRQRNGVTEETFESLEDFEHRIQPRDAMAYYGPGSFQPTIQNTIANEAGGSAGIVRNDGRYAQTVNIGVPGAVVDRAERQARVLDRDADFRPVSFRLAEISRECAVLRSSSAQGPCELFVVPGSSRLQFGRSHSAVDVRLVPEGEDSREDTLRKGYISNVHFSLCRNAGGRYVLRDGGSYKGEPWSPSTNGTCVNGVPLSGDPAVLVPGRSETVDLAPYAVSGGALRLTLEPRGWDDPAAADCPDRPGELSSLLLLRGDNPRKSVLVVWGASDLDALLGTRTGLRVVSLNGRLHVVGRDGRARRLIRLSGHLLPGTSYLVQ